MAHKCPKCHSANPDTQSFCGNCGTQLIKSDGRDVAFTKTFVTPAEYLNMGTFFAGRYEIIEELGKGGMGKVYKALDKEIHEEVAIKFLKPEIAADEKIIERFRNELKIARKITHENVCRTYDIGREEAAPYITMEYVPGEDLKSLIKKKGKLAKTEVLRIAKQVCEGLVVAHKLGVVHRDLKPQNIMIDEDGHAKIMDFGIARSVEAEGVTEAGVIIGTPDYISPEQADGEKADHRSDIYSLGVILYEMVTGDVPFKGDTALSVALKHKSQLPLDPRKINSDVSDDLSRLILICMEKNRERRYQTAEALLNDLRNIEEEFPLGTKIQPRRATFVQELIRRKSFVPAVAVALAVIAFAVWRFLPIRDVAFAPKIDNSIAIISFENLTGDDSNDVYQRSIPNLLITNLENTGHFYVATWERMRDLLKQMGDGEEKYIDSDRGFELCRREGIEALVVGSLHKAGDMFVTDVKVYDTETKRSIKSVSARGIGAQSIFSQIDELSREISSGMGLSQDAIESAKLQINEVTTSSMEAYNYFIKGTEQHEKFYFDEAIQLYEKALELDPTFASVYYKLVQIYKTLDNPKAYGEALEKAKAFSEKATEKERLFIEERHAYIKHDHEKRFQIIQRIIEKYPKEKEAYWVLGRYYVHQKKWEKAIQAQEKVLELDPDNNLSINEIGLIYEVMENYDKAIEYLKKAISLAPKEANPYDSLGFVYWKMGEIDNAITACKESLEIKPDFWVAAQKIALYYAYKEEYTEAIKSLDEYLSAASPRMEERGYLDRGKCHAWLGQFELSFNSLDRAYELADAFGEFRIKQYVTRQCLLIYFARGKYDLCRKYLDAYRELIMEEFPDWEPYVVFANSFVLALLELKKGNLGEARKRMQEMENILPEYTKRWPWFTESATSQLNEVRGEILLSEGNYEEAIAILEGVVSWQLRDNAMLGHDSFLLKDILGRAYKEGGELDKAIEEYERLTAFDPKSKDRFLIHPLYRYRLAKLYEEKGRDQKAIDQYERFLELWKDADEGLPELEDARERLAGLRKQ